MRSPNKTVETNRRPASPFYAQRQFESARCDPPSLSAAVAHLVSRKTHTMKTEHVLERIGHDLDRIGTGVLIGTALCAWSQPGWKAWPFWVAGGLVFVGAWMEFGGWRLRRRRELSHEKAAA